MSDEVLDGLRAAGRADSVGGFTLEAARAREMLARFQLAEPRAWVLLLVSSAVAAGAAHVDVRLRPHELVFEHDGLAPAREDLENLFSQPLMGRRGRADLRDLALALVAATGLRPRRLCVEAWKDGQGWRLHPDGRLEPLPPGPDRVRVVLRERLRPALRRALRCLEEGFPEERILEERCSLGLAWLRVNGRTVTGRVAPGACAVWSQLRGPGKVPGDSLPAADPRAPVSRDELSPGPWAMVLELGAGRADPEFEVVVNGVSHPVTGADLGYDDLRLVAACPALRLDASRAAVARDGEFESLLLALRREVRRSMELAAREWERFRGGPAAPAAARLLDHLARRLEAEGRLEEAANTLVHSLDLRQGPPGLEEAASRMALARLALARGQDWEAGNLLCRALDELRDRAARDPDWTKSLQLTPEFELRVQEIERAAGREAVRVAESLQGLAQALFERGRPRPAEPLAFKAWTLLHNRLPPEEPRRVTAQYLLARILERLGRRAGGANQRLERARDLYRELVPVLEAAAAAHRRRQDLWAVRATRERLYRAVRCLHGRTSAEADLRRRELMEACQVVGDAEGAVLYARPLPPD